MVIKNTSEYNKTNDGQIRKILLNRAISTINFNTQNVKVKTITETTLVIEIDVESGTYYARV